jgi:hypothetical protein
MHTHFVDEHFDPKLLDQTPLTPEEQEVARAVAHWIVATWYGKV